MVVASTELQPCAILAKGPPWMKAGVPSSVCTRLGAIASFNSAAMAPWALSSLGAHRFAVAGIGDDDVAEPLLQIVEILGQTEDRHHFGGDRDVEAGLARIAVGDAAERTTISRSARSFMSMTRRQATRRASMPSALPQ